MLMSSVRTSLGLLSLSPTEQLPSTLYDGEKEVSMRNRSKEGLLTKR